MNKYLILILGVMHASCSSDNATEKSSEADFNLTYTTDTVMVDAGDHFFFLNWGLRLSDISIDQKYLYNLNPESLLLEIVDLDHLKLKETVQLEREGPDGIGSDYYQKIQVLENGNICLFGQYRITIVSAQGKLVNSIEYDQLKLKDYGLQEDGEVRYSSVLSDDGKLLVSSLANLDYKQPAKGVVVIDLDNNSIIYFPLELFAELKQFEITFQVGNAPGISIGESTYFSFIENNLIVSSSAYNEVYQYSMSIDSLSHYSFEASLTDNEKILNYATQVSSDKGWDDSEKAKNEQVSFKEFFKLTKANVFWRLSRDKDRMIGDSTVFKFVATIFDPEFNMLKELELENFHNSSKTFIKDGMLYSFINLEDELAFVRLKPTITYE